MTLLIPTAAAACFCVCHARWEITQGSVHATSGIDNITLTMCDASYIQTHRHSIQNA